MVSLLAFRQLYSGVDTLKFVTKQLDSIDRITDVKTKNDTWRAQSPSSTTTVKEFSYAETFLGLQSNAKETSKIYFQVMKKESIAVTLATWKDCFKLQFISMKHEGTVLRLGHIGSACQIYRRFFDKELSTQKMFTDYRIRVEENTWELLETCMAIKFEVGEVHYDGEGPELLWYGK